jgi:2-methylcitrate dehydratase PrpD
VSKAVSTAPAEGDIGWSQTGIAGGIGAAAGAARALGLDQEGILAAISIGALQASGFRVAHGTMAGTLVMGQAGHIGLRAALLAQNGMGAPSAALEGKYGFARLFARKPHLAHITDDLGSRFEVESLGYKPYPCGVVIHPALDAALAWRAQHPTPRAEATRVRITAHPSATELGARRHPATILEAKVSLTHWVAAALARGQATLAEAALSAVHDPEIVRLRDAIELESSSSIAPDAAIMTIDADGEHHSIEISHCKGSIENPMSDADLSAKFHGQASMQLLPAQAADLLARCWIVDKEHSVQSLVELARP